MNDRAMTIQTFFALVWIAAGASPSTCPQFKEHTEMFRKAQAEFAEIAAIIPWLSKFGGKESSPELPPSDWPSILRPKLGESFIRQFSCCYVTHEIDLVTHQEKTVYHCHLRKLNQWKSRTPEDTPWRTVVVRGEETFVNGYRATPRD